MKKINYYLRENHLSTSDENLFVASVKNKETLYQDDLIDVMLGKNTTVTRQDILVVLDLFEESVKEQILSGYSLNTNLFKARVSIKGGFVSTADEFDHDRHQVRVNLNASSDFKKDLAFNARVERVLPHVTAPVIRQIFDFAAGDYVTAFQRGGLIEIKGAYLKDDQNETQVYLRQDGADESAALTAVHRVSDRSILCTLPEDLTPGSYWVSVALGEDDDVSRGKFPSLVTVA